MAGRSDMTGDLESFIFFIPFLYLGFAGFAYLIMRKHYP
jgi:hypothetical protein